MPRRMGQVDESKGLAILEAAREALAERGMGASIEDIARRAKVSKQTVYNRFGSKAELVRVLIERRVDQITAHLEQVRERDGLAVQLHLPATAARHGAHDLQAAPRFGRDPDLREASRARGVARQVEDRRDPSRLGIAPYDL